MSLADVIIVGGGPSGVAAALELRRRGVEKVVILDREPRLGGATRHCAHSPFGMREFGRVYFGATYGQRLEREVLKAGIEVRTSHTVASLGANGNLQVTSPSGVETLTARRIMVATGARETPRSARLISGDRPIGVVTTGTLQSYVAFYGLLPFRRPVIVGSELVSLSAVLTCVTHGARPAAIVETHEHALASAPLSWFPSILGIPFHRGAVIVDIIGRNRVEAIKVRKGDKIETIACDGLLLTGQFTPESSLFLQSPLGIDLGSAGPAVDQHGRTMDPLIFAAGNVLRGVETGGWAFREGRAIGLALANDLWRHPDVLEPVPVTFDDAVKLVVPSILRRNSEIDGGLRQFQLRFKRRTRGNLSLQIDGQEVWRKTSQWMPERRILVPIPPSALQAQRVHFHFSEDK